KVLAVIGQEVVPASARIAASVHVHHYGALAARCGGRRSPDVQSKAIFAALPAARAVEQEVVLVAARRIVAAFGDIDSAWTGRTVSQAASHAGPGLRLLRRHEAIGAAGRRPVWDAAEHEHTPADVAAHLSRGSLDDAFRVRRSDRCVASSRGL